MVETDPCREPCTLKKLICYYYFEVSLLLCVGTTNMINAEVSASMLIH